MLVVPYEEGLLIDYRWFDAKNITPRFEFGFGLSYTRFKYSNLRTYVLAPLEDDAYTALERGWDAGESTPDEVGASAAAWCVHSSSSQAETLTLKWTIGCTLPRTVCSST